MLSTIRDEQSLRVNVTLHREKLRENLLRENLLRENLLRENLLCGQIWTTIAGTNFDDVSLHYPKTKQFEWHLIL